MPRIEATFTRTGAPEGGLTPTIKIWDATNNSQIVNTAANITEIDDTETSGRYIYIFNAAAGYLPTIDYVGHWDGGTGLTGSERYKYFSSASILTTEVEGALTYGEIVRIMLSWMTGLVSGAGSDNIKWRDYANSKNRIEVTADEFGNRHSVTLDGE
ncbi:MAG: hypothetical protein GY853_13430 [PVC group bacterium]|nr:hypothetical protein [PVC group bacterium]